MALSFTTFCGFNFRGSLAGATDGTNEIGIYGGPSTQLWNGDYGYANPGTGNTETTGVDDRLKGRQTFASLATSFGINAPAGNYFLRLSQGAVNVPNIQTGCVVVDTVDSSFRTTGISAILATSGSATLGLYYVNNAQTRVYLCTTSGTYTSGNPVGTGTNIADGGVGRFSYVGEVLHIADTGASPTLPAASRFDVDGTIRAASAWPTAGTGGTQPLQKAITLTATSSPGLTITKHPNSAAMYLNHIAIKGVAPAFSVSPSISPGSGTAGTTLFTATDGTASDTTSFSRRWLLDGISIGTGTTVTPASAGTLVLEVTATGPGGATIANSSSVTVSAAATSTVRRGGMGLGLGLGFSFGGGGATSAVTATFPTGITALTPIPSPTTDHNAAASPVSLTNLPAMISAAITAGGDRRIYVAGGRTNTQLALSSKLGDPAHPIHIVAADSLNPPIIGTPYASNAPPLDLSNCTGLVFRGLKFCVDDGPASGAALRYVVRSNAGNSDITFVGCEIYGNRGSSDLSNQTRLFNSNSGSSVDTINRLKVFNCYLHDAEVGINFDGDNTEFAFNKFANMLADSLHFAIGSQNQKIYLNYQVLGKSVDGFHSDMMQWATSANTFQPHGSNIVWGNRNFCDPSQPAHASGVDIGYSTGRSQMILIQDDASKGVAFGSFIIQDNMGYGTLPNGILINWTINGLTLKDNFAYHIVGPDTPPANNTKIEISGSSTGTASGNGGYIFNNFCAGVTGQVSSTPNTTKTTGDVTTDLAAFLTRIAPYITYCNA